MFTIDYAGKPIGAEDTCGDGEQLQNAQEGLQNRYTQPEERAQQQTAKLERARKKPRLELLERRQSVAPVKEDEQRLHSILDVSPSILFVKNRQGRYTYVNSRFQRICDLSRDEIIGKTDRQLFPPSQAEAFLANDLTVFRTGTPLEFEETALQKDGLHTSIVTKFPLRDLNGSVNAICGIVTDITERKRSERALRESEARLRLIMGQIPAIVWTTDTELAITSYSGAGLARLKLRANANLGVKLFKLLQTQDRTFLPVASHLRALKGESTSFEYNWQGFTYQTRVEPLRGSSGQVVGCLGLALDITRRKQAQQALRDSQERFRLLVEGVKDYAIVMLDAEGYVLSWNLGAERIKGYRPEEIIGRHFSSFYSCEDIRAGKPELGLKAAAAEGRFEDEGWRVRKDGSRFWANVVITALLDADGNLRGFAKVTQDVTERKKAEESVRELSGRLLSVQDEERRRMARELHDSSAQTLSALSLNLALANQYVDPVCHPQAAKALSDCLSLADQASREVRTFSYLLHPPLLDQAGLAQALQWLVEGFAQRTKIRVDLELSPPKLERLPRDTETALFRIVQECLTNIYRHSESSTAVVRLDWNSKETILQVEDQGKGMPKTLGQGDGKPAALGVGIRGMRERVRQLGGSMDIRSGNPGTLVEVVLPSSGDNVCSTESLCQ